MSKELLELVKQYELFKQVTPIQIGGEHDFAHFMAWLQKQYIMNGT